MQVCVSYVLHEHTHLSDFLRDLRSRSAFIKPFLIACSTRNPKFAGNAVSCLQRLIVANALPQDALGDVLDALRDCSTLALDIQLKVLQALPSLLQNYAVVLSGQLLIATFQICFLLHSNKTAVVTNLAAAALQQLISLTFEKSAGDRNGLEEDVSPSVVPIADGMIQIFGSRSDSYNIFDDICLLTEGQKPKHIHGAVILQTFGLELVESVLANHADVLATQPEDTQILRIRLMPLLAKILSEKASFSLTVRAMRLVRLILSSLLSQLISESEVLLSLLNHMLDPDAASPWKRAICLEVFKTLHANPALIRSIYAQFDDAEEKRNIVRDHLGSLVRLASEKPAVIGLGQQSSIPSIPTDESGEQAALQAGGLVGSIGASIDTIDINTSGISNRWSALKVPFIEQLDKSEPSQLPATYIYSLALTCLTSFEEGLARFLLPFTVPPKKKPKRRAIKSHATSQETDAVESAHPSDEERSHHQGRKSAINPLSLSNHPQYNEISTSAHMIDHCWPALLAASSTFLNASMDSENFHVLIRSFQKFTQIAGLLGFSTPRDAFLTTLGKHALPSSQGTKVASTPLLNSYDVSDKDDVIENSRDASLTPSLSSFRRRQSIDMDPPVINSRHLLCLRALLNLGVALGPVLHKAWTIILEVLQQADLLMSALGSGRRKQRSRQKPESTPIVTNDEDDSKDLGFEATAAETAASRLFESTAELTNGAFLDHLECLCDLLNKVSVLEPESKDRSTILSPSPGVRKHERVRSVSGRSADYSAQHLEGGFILEKLKVVVECNVRRLAHPESEENGWDLLSMTLMKFVSSSDELFDLRVGSTILLNEMLVLTAVSDDVNSHRQLEANRARSLRDLLHVTNTLYVNSEKSSNSSEQCEIEIHRSALESLHAILEHCGDSLTRGWTEVFDIILSAFKSSSNPSSGKALSVKARSPVLIRSSFVSLELICSDFLSSIPFSNLHQLLTTLYCFSAQTYDLNVSLITATYFRTLSDYLMKDNEIIVFDDISAEQLRVPREAPNKKHDLPSTPLLWLSLLAQLTKLSKDSRIEPRHSALRTIFRILDAHSDRVSHSSFRRLYDFVIAPLLEANQLEYITASQDEGEELYKSGIGEWNKTAVVLIEGVTRIFSQWFDSLRTQSYLSSMFLDLIGRLQEYLERKVLIVSKAIFGGISKMLAEVEDQMAVDLAIIESIWKLWDEHSPVNHAAQNNQIEDNNEALLAHLYCLGQLLRLSGQKLEAGHAKVVMKQLEISIQRANAPAYSTDFDSMTAVQKAVLESMKMLPSVNYDCDVRLLGLISKLVNMAYVPRQPGQPAHASYIALSKASMAFLEAFIGRYMENNRTQFLSVMPSSALSAVYEPIRLKYKWQRTGREPSTWKTATKTAVAIIQMLAPSVDRSSSDGQDFWEMAVKAMSAIISADCEACINKETILQDQAFDIDAFSAIVPFFMPALGDPKIADSLCKKFSEGLFQNSLVHEPNPDDLARPGEDLLQGLERDHFGRVKDLYPSPRSKMSYLVLDQLFDLVAVHDRSEEQKRLAKAAYPYLILRIGITLKTYVLDQPLRGRMPQPRSQKNEMLYILKTIMNLSIEPAACGDGQEVYSGHKAHLKRLYPFILKALKAAWRDEVMTNALQDVLESMPWN